MDDSTPPDDLEEQEHELYALFGELRREFQHAVFSLTEGLWTRVELAQEGDERLQQPNFIDMLTSGLSSFINIFKDPEPREEDTVDDLSQDDIEPPRSDEEQDSDG